MTARSETPAASAASSPESVPSTADRELAATRVFNAPRDLVWQAWTHPDHIARWWGPHGFTTTTDAFDLRPGGVWRFTMHGPDGTDYPNKVTFLEVAAPDRLVYKHGGEGEPVDFHTTVTFEDLPGGQTRLTMRMLFPSAAARNFTVQKYGADQGLYQTLDRLVAHVTESAPPSPDREIAETRLLDAPPALAFSMFTDPAHLRHWWGPHGFTTTTHAFDLRPGGVWRFTMHGPDGTDYPNTVTYMEIVEPSRLLYRHDGGDESFHVAVTFAPADGGRTRLTFRLICPSKEFRESKRGAVDGLRMTLDRLEGRLAQHPAGPGPFTISRTFDAPRDLVWQAWTSRDHLMKWFGPKGFPMTTATLDFRPGGSFHYCLRSSAGQEMWGKFLYREILPPHRITWVNCFSDPAGNVTRPPFPDPWPTHMLTTVTLTADAPDRTTVTIESSALDASDVERQTFDSHHDSMRAGWTGTFDQLAAHLSTP